jgi:integrase
MRKRTQRSGKTYYYLDTGARPRKEIPLGDDYILALRKYTDLHKMASPTHQVTMDDVIKRYRAEELPKHAANTIRVQTSDLKHLESHFCNPPAPLDAIRPAHIRRFLDSRRDKPTTANRCKRLLSTMWNLARDWDYTDLPNPCTGIIGFELGKREVYITDEVFKAVWNHATTPLRDALDLGYLTGQRPADAMKMTSHDIEDGHLIVQQGKTKQKLRIAITGQLAELLGRIVVRKAQYRIECASLLVNTHGKPMTKAVLRKHFAAAKKTAIAKHPDLKAQIDAFWFYDLRAKAADDTADQRGGQAASDLLGHENTRTTARHYLRRGKIVAPTK